MTTRIAIIFSLMTLALPLLAGEQPSLRLTGNPTVDFFGGTSLTANQLTAPPTPIFQSEMGESAAKEKSPWVAGLLSLVVPGAGEVYSENYLKGALFFAADVAAWALAYTYDKKGDRQTDEFQAFANEHWSAVRYTEWTLDHLPLLTEGQLARTQYEDLVYDSDYTPGDPCYPPFRCIEWAQLNAMEDSIGHYAPPGGNGYTHRLPYYAEQQYYELIGKYPEFSRGWDDSGVLDPTGTLDSQLPIQSTSARFFEYANMRAQANHYYDIAGTWVTVAVLNHVLSAADAFWSTTKYNSALHAEARMRLQPTMYGMVPVTEVKVKYNF